MAKAGNLAKHLFTNLTCQIHAVTTISETRAFQHSTFHNRAKIISKLQLIISSYILFLHLLYWFRKKKSENEIEIGVQMIWWYLIRVGRSKMTPKHLWESKKLLNHKLVMLKTLWRSHVICKGFFSLYILSHFLVISTTFVCLLDELYALRELHALCELHL